MNPLVSPSDSPAVGAMVGPIAVGVAVVLVGAIVGAMVGPIAVVVAVVLVGAIVGAMVGPIVEFIVGAIVGALVGVGVDAITLTTTIPKSATLETNISTQESGVTQQQVISRIHLLEPKWL